MDYKGLEDLFMSDLSNIHTTNRLALEHNPTKLNYLTWAAEHQIAEREKGTSREDWKFMDKCALKHKSQGGTQDWNPSPKAREFREENYAKSGPEPGLRYAYPVQEKGVVTKYNPTPRFRDNPCYPKPKAVLQSPAPHPTGKRVASQEPPNPPKWKARTENENVATQVPHEIAQGVADAKAPPVVLTTREQRRLHHGGDHEQRGRTRQRE